MYMPAICGIAYVCQCLKIKPANAIYIYINLKKIDLPYVLFCLLADGCHLVFILKGMPAMPYSMSPFLVETNKNARLFCIFIHVAIIHFGDHGFIYHRHPFCIRPCIATGCFFYNHIYKIKPTIQLFVNGIKRTRGILRFQRPFASILKKIWLAIHVEYIYMCVWQPKPMPTM